MTFNKGGFEIRNSYQRNLRSSHIGTFWTCFEEDLIEYLKEQYWTEKIKLLNARLLDLDETDTDGHYFFSLND